ncbi:MAG: TlpA disulfide reductase family protein [Candidatus Competibacter sp.]|nr:TlpA disulfide reductase family protein [Candidatus Competibacter sp.]MDG4584364.1 TlpA disulfide reductase family protein [Candidatus Competibacter sp.]
MNPLRTLPFLLLSVLLTGCEQNVTATKTASPAPAFALERLDGPTAHFPEQYRGQVVAIRFWADWCPYCHAEMQALEPVYRRHREQGLAILAVNVLQPPETVRTFVQGLDISYEALLDPQGEVTRDYRVMGLPMTFIVDRKGVIRARIVGESTPEVFEQAITPWL